MFISKISLIHSIQFQITQSIHFTPIIPPTQAQIKFISQLFQLSQYHNSIHLFIHGLITGQLNYLLEKTKNNINNRILSNFKMKYKER